MGLKKTQRKQPPESPTCFAVVPSPRGWLVVTEASGLELGVFPDKEAAKAAAKSFAHANPPSRVKVYSAERRK